MKTPAWAIWNGSHLEGVTLNPSYATEAHKRGAFVIRFDPRNHDEILYDEIPNPFPEAAQRIADHHEARLPLGWEGVPIMQPEKER